MTDRSDASHCFPFFGQGAGNSYDKPGSDRENPGSDRATCIGAVVALKSNASRMNKPITNKSAPAKNEKAPTAFAAGARLSALKLAPCGPCG